MNIILLLENQPIDTLSVPADKEKDEAYLLLIQHQLLERNQPLLAQSSGKPSFMFINDPKTPSAFQRNQGRHYKNSDN